MTASSLQLPDQRPTTAALWRTFAISLGVYAVLAWSWAATTPMFGVPDEISHMIRAAGAARGDVSGMTDERGDVRYRAPEILVPKAIDGSTRQPCYAFDRQLSPACMVLAPGDRDTRIVSSASAYPPLYYLLVGWPSGLFGGLRGLYGMRAASALCFAALLALATVSLRRAAATRAAYAGLALALTPMVWFLGGSVNPSAIAAAAGVATWCGGYVLVTGRGAVDRTSAMAFGLPLCVLLLLRRDSILWGGIVVVALALLLRRDRPRELLRSRAVLGWALASFVCAFFAARVGASEGPGVLSATGGSGSASAAFGRILVYLDEMIGVLGWLDTPLPRAAYMLWYLALGALVLRAVGEASRRTVASLAFVALAVGGAIVAIGSQVFPYFQGRYGLPAAVGVPLLAGLALGRSMSRRATVVVIVAAMLVEVVAFYHQVRRYAFPGSERVWIFARTVWTPPTGPLLALVLLHLLAVVAVVTWWWRRADTI